MLVNYSLDGRGLSKCKWSECGLILSLTLVADFFLQFFFFSLWTIMILIDFMPYRPNRDCRAFRRWKSILKTAVIHFWSALSSYLRNIQSNVHSQLFLFCQAPLYCWYVKYSFLPKSDLNYKPLIFHSQHKVFNGVSLLSKLTVVSMETFIVHP